MEIVLEWGFGIGSPPPRHELKNEFRRKNV